MRLLRNSKCLCWNLYSPFLTFNYLKCFVRTLSPKTQHHTEHIGISCSWSALPNLNKPSTPAAKAILYSQRGTSSLALWCIPRLQTSAGNTARSRAGVSPPRETKEPSEDSHLLYRTYSFLFLLQGYSAYEIHNKFSTLWKYSLISHMKVQWDVQVPLMILIVILIWLTFLPWRIFSVISIMKILTLAISIEHTDFI